MAINSTSPSTYTSGFLITDTNVPVVTGGSSDAITTKITTSAALDVQSVKGAFIPPRMTTTQRTALTASAGMIVYDTTLTLLMTYQNGAWGSLSNGGTVVTNATTAYTVLATDNIVILTDTNTAAVAVTIPTASAATKGKIFYIKDGTTASVHTITITPVSGTIDGATNVTITTDKGSRTLFNDGTNWWTIS